MFDFVPSLILKISCRRGINYLNSHTFWISFSCLFVFSWVSICYKILEGAVLIISMSIIEGVCFDHFYRWDLCSTAVPFSAVFIWSFCCLSCNVGLETTRSTEKLVRQGFWRFVSVV